MHKTQYILIFLFISLLGLNAQSLLVGYYPSWAQNSFTAADVQWEHVTHVAHAFVWPKADGSLGYEAGFWYPALTQQAHQHNRKVILSVGGAGQSAYFSPVAADAGKRAAFVSALVNAVQQHDYDGVDVDWEFPQTEADKNNLLTFISELYNALHSANPDYLLTMAIPSGNYYGQWFRYDVLKLYVNWFNVMTYDYHGDWFSHSGHNAPLYPSPDDACGSVDETCVYLTDTRGIAKDKLCIGLPFYGRKFYTSGLYQSSTGGGQTDGYNDIAGLIDNGWRRHWDTVSLVPYLTNTAGTQLYTYDDTTSIRYKCDYIIAHHYKGGMIWALGLDQLSGNKQPLLEVASAHLAVTALADAKGKPLPPAGLDLDVFPNPFKDLLEFNVTAPDPQNAVIRVFDTRGRLVASWEGRSLNSHSHLIRIGRDWSSGVFYVVLKGSMGLVSRKIVHIK